MKQFYSLTRKITLIIVLALTCVQLFAQGGETGPLAWNLNNGTLTISGNGAMPDYDFLNAAPWTPYYENITTAIIENGVTSIGSFAFFYCAALTSITIRESVTSIGMMAFSGCIALPSITISSSVTTIGNAAFTACTALTSINVNSENANYSSENGVLFNKNKTILICYPAGKTENDYIVPNTVTNIKYKL
jgi:hypothetical protein